MQYKIHTTPIWDAFKTEDCLCPMCHINQELVDGLVDRYLNEAVMVPISRQLVNKYGFCWHHYNMLLKGDNILGVALQSITRTEHLQNIIKPPKNLKSATKQATELLNQSSSCVICQDAEKTMDRYYMTVAQMYYNEPPFMKALDSSRGFCLFHYAKLMQNARHARSKSISFLESLYSVQISTLAKLKSNLESFSQKFDYQKKDIPWGNNKDAPWRTSQIITKKKI
ncbi:MAG TPA: hypothetical protein GX745_00130 [Clostridiales bacterium]|nr:hypothetical protein [Clostridiales bacterium]